MSEHFTDRQLEYFRKNFTFIGKEPPELFRKNREMNAVVDDIVRKYSNVDLLDMRKIVVSRKQLVLHDNRHFDRASYYAMAQEISRLCGGSMNVKSYVAVEAGRFIMKVLRKLKRAPRKMKRIFLKLAGKNIA